MPDKPKPVADFNWEELDQVRQDHRLAKMADRPPGFTNVEYAERFGLSLSGARKEIQALMRAGKVQVVGHDRRDNRNGRMTVQKSVYNFVKGSDPGQ